MLVSGHSLSDDVRFPSRIYGQTPAERRAVGRRDRRPILIGGVVATAVLTFGGAIGAAAGPSSALPNGADLRASVSPRSAAPHLLRPTHRMRAWADGGGLAILNGISNDLADDQAAAGSEDFQATRLACEHLGRDVAAGQAYAAIPAVGVQAEWAEALQHFGAAATACVHGIATNSAALLSRAGDELEAGAPYAQAVVAAITR